MTDCEERQRPRTFRGEDAAPKSNEATSGPPGDGWTCGDAMRFRDAKEQSLDRTLSETFPCSDPLSSLPNPGARLVDDRGEHRVS